MTITGWLALPLLLLAPYFDASVITSPLGTQSTTTVEDDDLVITGQKLRTVPIRYQRSGRRVTSCEATQSSGKADINRLMCAFVRGCVTVGFTPRRAAMTCVNERIDRLATDSQDTIQSVLQAEDISKPTDPETDDIVVIGTRLVVWSQRLMVQQPQASGRRRYGPGCTRERYDDRGRSSSEQHSKESLRALAKRHGLNQKTIAWLDFATRTYPEISDGYP